MPTFPPGVHLKGGANAAPVHAETARTFYAPITPIVVELRAKGLSLRGIARELEARGIKPRYNYEPGSWSAGQVRRILLRADEQAKKARPPAPPLPPAPLPVLRPAAALRTVQPPTPRPAPVTSPPADPEAACIQLLLHGAVRGPFTKNQVKAMLDRREIGRATRCLWPGGEWRPVEELFRDTAKVTMKA